MTVPRPAVELYWEANPCSEADQKRSVDDDRFYLEQENERYDLQPFIPRFAGFSTSAGRRILEVGVGLGADHTRFARAGAVTFGVDITWPAALHTTRRFHREGLRPRLVIADAQQLPFRDRAFDVVYSFGVLHHTPDPSRACADAARVVRSNGTLKLMLYNRRSLLGFQVWLLLGLLKGKPSRSARSLIEQHVESPGTQAYSVRELRELIPQRFDVSVETVVTPYDCRIGRRRYLPRWVWRFIPRALGWNHLITARATR